MNTGVKDGVQSSPGVKAIIGAGSQILAAFISHQARPQSCRAVVGQMELIISTGRIERTRTVGQHVRRLFPRLMLEVIGIATKAVLPKVLLCLLLIIPV